MLAARKTYLITARARKNKRTARMLASARKDHSIPLNVPPRFDLMSVIRFRNKDLSSRIGDQSFKIVK